jgi:hypothetical protein
MAKVIITIEDVPITNSTAQAVKVETSVEGVENFKGDLTGALFLGAHVMQYLEGYAKTIGLCMRVPAKEDAT